jgi:hypothetical protein
MRFRLLQVTLATAMCLTLFGATSAHANQIVTWEGNGLDSVTECVKGVNTPYLHWVLTPGGKPVEGTSADLFINGKNRGSMTPVGNSGALQLTIYFGSGVKFDDLQNADVYAEITSGSVGENAVLTISDGCLCDHML